MKKENLSLFIYTSLIFIVSIAMILIAFVGQNNIDKLQNSGSSLSNRVHELSDANGRLLNQNTSLSEAVKSSSDRITKLEDELNDKEREIETIATKKNTLAKLIEIKNLIDDKKIEQAKALYSEIDPLTLDESQLKYYNNIKF